MTRRQRPSTAHNVPATLNGRQRPNGPQGHPRCPWCHAIANAVTCPCRLRACCRLHAAPRAGFVPPCRSRSRTPVEGTGCAADVRRRHQGEGSVTALRREIGVATGDVRRWVAITVPAGAFAVMAASAVMRPSGDLTRIPRSMLLSVRDVTLRFGGIVALDGVSFDVDRGVVAGLIGPNGAGKTTTFNVITRLYTPDSGEVELDGGTLLRTPPHRVVRRGIARTFQNINLFRTMTVLENVLVGGHARGRRRARDGGARGARDRRARRSRGPARRGVAVRDRRSGSRSPARSWPAEAAPPGRARRRPQPRGGRGARRLHPASSATSAALTILLVEHHMSLVMRVSDHVNVLSFGRKIADGDARRGSGRPRRDRGVPRGGASERRSSSSTTSRRATGRSRRSAASRSRCPRARSSPCSARTAPERRRRCAPSRARCAARGDRLRRKAAARRARGRRAGGHRARPRGARHVHRADGHREPQARRLHAPRSERASADIDRVVGVVPVDRRARATSRPGRSRAGSSRCSRSRARSWRGRAC